MKFSEIRQQISSKISVIPGYKESKQTPAFFGRTQETIAHRAYTIEVGISQAAQERQRRDVGVYITTPINVIFAYRLRPLDVYPIDYDLALDDEVEIINAALSVYNSQHFTIRYIGSERQIAESQEWIIITISFTTLHTI